jgi:hypothetical protein
MFALSKKLTGEEHAHLLSVPRWWRRRVSAMGGGWFIASGAAASIDHR